MNASAWSLAFSDMVERHDATKIPVETVQVGFTLLIPSEVGQPPKVFNVQGTKITHDQAAGEKPKMTLTSEPLADGNPWVLEYPFGAEVVKALRTYDDGT